MAEIGSTIPRNNPRYQILKKIGQGGMSEVYLANDLQMDMMVAVKEVRTDIEYDKHGRKVDLNAYIKGLENECDLLKSVDHPVLPRTLSIDRGQKIYVIMDYIDGEDMSKILKRDGKLSQEQVLDCALQVCDALRYLQAHNPPIVYRDLKPSNIMWKNDGGFKLIDFGTAIEYRPGQKYPNMGTRGFGAPEQLRKQNPVADQRSDIYSLGATMYCLLTGKTPNEELMQKHTLREFNPTVSIGLENVIKRCVEPDPNARYQSAAELLYALEHYDEEDASFKNRQRGKLRLFIAAASLAGVMLIAGAGLLIARQTLMDESYEANIAANTEEGCLKAIELQPANPQAYFALLDIFTDDGIFSREEAETVASRISNADAQKMKRDSQYAELCYTIANSYFYLYEGSGSSDLSARLKSAVNWYQKVVQLAEDEGVRADTAEAYEMSKNYCELNEIYKKLIEGSEMTQTGVEEVTSSEVETMLQKMRTCLDETRRLEGGNAKYAQVVTGDAVCFILSSSAKTLSDLGIDKSEVLALLNEAYTAVKDVGGVTNKVTKEIIEDLGREYATYYNTVNSAYENKANRDIIKQSEGAV